MELYSKVGAEKRVHYFDAFESLEELVVKISSTEFAGASFGDIEAEIHKNGMEVLRKMAQGYLNQRSCEEIKMESVIGEDGETRTHRRPHCSRKIESKFGEVTVERIGYRGPELSFIFPLDAQLNLPPNKYSHGLQDEVAHLVAVESFDETLESLERQGGGIVPKRQLQGICAELVQDFDEFYEQPLEPSVAEEERILVITADGKGVSMHNQDLRDATRAEAEKAQKKKKARLRPGEKKSRKLLSTVVSVYEIAPYYRTPEQILGISDETLPPRPKPENKRVWANITEDMSTVIGQGFEEALKRDPEQQMKWVVLIDGQTELINQVSIQAEKHSVEVTITQDIIHVIEYLWKAAHALHPQDPEKREQWVRDRTFELMNGNAQNVASGLRRAATRADLDQKKREPVDTAANYIQNNKQRLKYDESLEQGLPIATGVIEGACRHIVKDRMDLTGARWRLKSADAVLKLRSLKASGDLSEYLQLHFLKEEERNYGAAANDDVFAIAA
jgi:hypothetical protein